MSNMDRQPSIFTVEDASKIAFTLYGLQAEACPLPGELDHNFRLQTTAGQEFVLKIAHAGQQKDILDLQNKAMAYLAAHNPSLLLPQVCATSTGESMGIITASNGMTHFVRMLTYIPGRLLAEVKPHTPELLYSLGQTLGKLDDTLQGFRHTAAQRTLKWDLQHTLWIRDYLQHIAAPERRAIVENFVEQFETHVMPVLPRLRQSVIHNDANDYNVLVNPAAFVGAGFTPALSVIDFGDMVHTYTVCELAIAAAYAMLGKPDPLRAAAQVVAGYHAAFPLSEVELEVLYPLICSRLSISVVNSAYQQKVEPHNVYLTISEAPAWSLLEQLAHIHPRLAHYTFRHACGLPPCPSTSAIINWLTSHAGTFSSVVEPDLRTANTVIFDLSVGSRELGNLQNVSDLVWFNQHIFGRMQAAQSSVGIGRYNEVRQIYTSDAYKIEGNNGPEWRTVHVGLDIFMEPDSPVLAPLDGIVHSFHNNVAQLDYGPTIILQHTVAAGQLTFFTLYGHLSLDSLD
ncbi:MAG: phosphotransferase, partial [Ktedonobacteraceae bacterium]